MYARSVEGRMRFLPVQAALEWAFATEKAQIELPEAFEVLLGRGYGIGTMAVLEQRALIGCQVDGGGRSDPHEDAEAIAAAVSNLPDRRMAIEVAELARARLTPDWMPGVVPRLVPVAWRAENQYGPRAVTDVAEVVHVRVRGRMKRCEVLYCPCTWKPTQHQIDAARDRYGQWVRTLVYLRDWLQEVGPFRTVTVTDALPPVAPWERPIGPRLPVVQQFE